jgi:Arc/MetJ family transcription regulator
MAQGRVVKVCIDANLVREVREILGARNNREAVELAITIALALRFPGNAEAAKYLEMLGSDRFRI